MAQIIGEKFIANLTELIISLIWRASQRKNWTLGESLHFPDPSPSPASTGQGYWSHDVKCTTENFLLGQLLAYLVIQEGVS